LVRRLTRMCGVKRFVLLLGVLVLFASASASGRPVRVLGGYGVSLSLAQGWHGLAAPGQLQAADFPLARDALDSAQSVRVPRGHVHLIVWDYGPSVPYLSANFPHVRAPLAIGPRDITGAPLEGFPTGDAFAIRSVTVGDEVLEIVADLGPKPLAPERLYELNRLLATLHVRSPRVLRPRKGRLVSDGVAVRLLGGWSGRIEVPADPHGARLVLRAGRGHVHIVLLELAGGQGRHLGLPIRVAKQDIIRRHALLIARRVFSTGGRGFDLSVTVASPGELMQANLLLATLTVAPRPWMFHSCDLTLRLPGTWRAAVNPRDKCYPVITLRAPGVRIVLTELRPKERASGRVLRQSGRRFEIDVTPRSAEHEAAAVLATLRAATRK
jgi:hypothetical protein